MIIKSYTDCFRVANFMYKINGARSSSIINSFLQETPRQQDCQPECLRLNKPNFMPILFFSAQNLYYSMCNKKAHHKKKKMSGFFF